MGLKPSNMNLSYKSIYLSPMWPWTNYLLSLSFSFFFCKMEMTFYQLGILRCQIVNQAYWRSKKLIFELAVQFSPSVMSNSLQPHGLQHTRLPCPSPTPGAYSNSRPSSQWCHPISHPLLSPSLPALNLSQRQGLFQWVSSCHQVGEVLEFQLQHQSFQWIFRIDFLYNWLLWSLCSPRDSQESSPTPQFKSINSLVLSFLYSQI